MTNYAVFGSDVNLNAVVVGGDVGVANRTTANGILLFAAASRVNGDLYVAQGASMSLPPDNTYWGELYQSAAVTSTLTAARSQLYTASSALAALPVDQTLGNVTTDTTITGITGMVKVVNITGNVNLSDESITLTGGASDYFVLNIAGDFDLAGSGGIALGGSVSASHVLINIIGENSSLATSKVGNSIAGTLLAPKRQLEFHSVNGAIYTGDLECKLMSNATVSYVKFDNPPVPLPAAVWMGGVMLGALAVARRRFR